MERKLIPYKKGSKQLAIESLQARNFKLQFELQEEAWLNRFAKEVAKYKEGDECIASGEVFGDFRLSKPAFRVRIDMPPIVELEDKGYKVRYNVKILTKSGKNTTRYNKVVDEEDLTPIA